MKKSLKNLEKLSLTISEMSKLKGGHEIPVPERTPSATPQTGPPEATPQDRADTVAQ